MDLIDFFTKDLSPRQKQYEAIRAVAFHEGSIKQIAQRFGYTPQSLRTLINQLLKGKHQLFPEIKRGPKTRRLSEKTQALIIKLRREKKLNTKQITELINQEGLSISVRTVERFLADAGFPKLRRRTNKERGISKNGTLLSQRSVHLDFTKLKPFQAQCQVAGVFFFLPYILETGVLDIVQDCPLPQSSDIGKQQAALSMLLLKLIGNKRLSHIKHYSDDSGFGVFAGLNVLPKPTYMCTYSCLAGDSVLMDFQRRLVERFRFLYPDLYQGKIINLDFHTIPHFGDLAELEKVWSGVHGKALKGANTFFAQDGQSDSILYTRADIKRSESSEEIKNFVDYWIKVNGVVDGTLVFDSKLTRYDILYELDGNHIKFITLRKRCSGLNEQTLKIAEKDWERIYLPIPKRKYKYFKIHESKVSLIKGKKELRQIIIKDHGRSEPTYLISNNDKLPTKELLTIYAKKSHIENKLSELVGFFNLNALSSPLMIRIHFDVLWTVIADTLYHLFARDLRRFENCKADKIFKQFVDMPGLIEFDGNSFTVKIRKRSSTPVLLGLDKLNSDIPVPWLGNRPLKIRWVS